MIRFAAARGVQQKYLSCTFTFGLRSCAEMHLSGNVHINFSKPTIKYVQNLVLWVSAVQTPQKLFKFVYM